MKLVHASCVAVDGAGVLIRGPSGSGKSDLSLRLIDEGADLVSDDYCRVSVNDESLTANAPEEIAGKIEVRGLGIVEMPWVSSVPIALVVDLKAKEDIERLPEDTSCIVEGVEVPWVAIDPETISATAKIRLALKHTIHGKKTSMAKKKTPRKNDRRGSRSVVCRHRSVRGR